MEMKNFIQALVAAVLTAIVAAIFKYVDPPTILTELWQRVFVGPWFLWLGAAGFGVYWLVRLLVKLHQDTRHTIPELLKANKELVEKQLLAKTNSLELLRTASELSLETEARSRVAATDLLSERINALDTRIQKDLPNGLDSLKGQLFGVIKNEAHERTDGINAINRRIDVDFERMNKLETSLPNQIFGRIQEIEQKFTAQISDLNKRIEKVEPQLGLNLETANRLGIFNSIPPATAPHEVIDTRKGTLGQGMINTIPPVPTPQEALVQAILDRKKNKKET